MSQREGRVSPPHPRVRRRGTHPLDLFVSSTTTDTSPATTNATTTGLHPMNAHPPPTSPYTQLAISPRPRSTTCSCSPYYRLILRGDPKAEL